MPPNQAGIRASRITLAVALALFVSGCMQEPQTAPRSDAQPAPSEPEQDEDGYDTAPGTSSSPAGNQARAPRPTPTEPEQMSNATDQTAGDNATPPAPKPVWGAPEAAIIYPGIKISTGYGACTTNFLFTSLDNRHIYLGTAAHCLAGETAPCYPNTNPAPPGHPVRFSPGNETYLDWWTGTPVSYHNLTGTLAYNSWYTLNQSGVPSGDPACGQDFALIELPIEAQGLITPHFRRWGPATSILNVSQLVPGLPLVSYGHSTLWFNQEPLHQKQGMLTTPPWDPTDPAFSAVFVPNAVWGDSGSAVMTPDGGAAGILVYLANGSVVLRTALDFMEAHTDLRVKLAEP